MEQIISKKWWLIALLFCLAVATISPLASSAPDGLERIAKDQGFIGTALESPFAVIAGYIFPGVGNEAMATILAGWIGTIVLFAAVYLFARLARLRRGASA